MSLDVNRVDKLLQFALLVAGDQDDYIDRQLGPIHLIKYVYLADLAYISRERDETYTGTPWKFHNFGPWSTEVFKRIDPALAAVNAEKSQLESDYGDNEDYFRWQLRDEELLARTARELPNIVVHRIRQDVRKYGKDTHALLHHVYRTTPMLSAAPGQLLDMALAEPVRQVVKSDDSDLRFGQLSNKKKKRFKERIREIQKENSHRVTTTNRLVNPVPNPRFDEIYEQGVEWLDSLAGADFEATDVVAEFDHSVWGSATRRGEDDS
jgi:hypothetical protein